MSKHYPYQYFNAGNIFLGVLAIATVRDFIEVAFKGGLLLESSEPLKSLKMYFLHFNFFYFLVYASLSLILYLFARKNVYISMCFKIGALAMMLIWVAPVFDYLTPNNFNMFYPPDPMDIICHLHHFIDPTYQYEGLSMGMRLEILLAGMGGTFFLYYHTRHIISSVIGGLLISLTSLAIGLLIPFISQLYEYGWHFGRHELHNSILLHQGFVIHGTGCKIALFYLLLCMVIFSVAYYIRNPRYFNCIVRNFRWTRIIHYGLLLGGGIFYIYHNPPIGDFEYLKTIWNHPTDLFGIFMAFMAIVLLFQSAVIFNDIYDYDIDVISNPNRPLVTKTIPVSEYMFIGKILAILALTISFCISETFFFFVLLYNLLAFLYSAPPFRLRKYFLVSNMLLATIFMVTFHAGASVLISDYRFEIIPPYITFGLLIAYALALTVKDSKDFEGDKASHVQTLHTLIGKKAGDVVTVILVCFATILTPVLLHLKPLLLFSIIICGVFLFLITQIKRRNIKERCIIALYYIYVLVIFYSLCSQFLVDSCELSTFACP